MKKSLQFNYDSKYDVLYISTIPNQPAIGYEEQDGIVIRRSRSTGEFVGITIFDFKKRLESKDFPGVFEFIEPSFLYSIGTQNSAQ